MAKYKIMMTGSEDFYPMVQRGGRWGKWFFIWWFQKRIHYQRSANQQTKKFNTLKEAHDFIQQIADLEHMTEVG